MSIESDIEKLCAPLSYGDSSEPTTESVEEIAAYVRSKLRELGGEIKKSKEFTVSRSMDPFEGGKREKAHAIYGVVEAAVERMCGKEKGFSEKVERALYERSGLDYDDYHGKS